MRRAILAALSVAMLTIGIAQVKAQAPAPAAQARPDLTGTWGPYRGARGARGTTDPLAGIAAGTPTLKAEFAKAYTDRRGAQQAATQRGEPVATNAVLCKPYGVPTMMSVASYPIEVIQTPKQVTIVTEAFSEVRRVYLDKPLMNWDDVPPGYYGRSIGKWEGDTLVVDTVGIKDSVQYQNIPHSAQMRITERFRLAAPNVLHDEITITDPLFLEKPLTYRLSYSRMPDYEMVEFVCDNNKEFVDANGVVRMRTSGAK